MPRDKVLRTTNRTHVAQARQDGTPTGTGPGGGSSGGAIGDHALLSHLDYASAGHTGFVPGTRLLTAGAGLSGGGDLSADRTVAVAGNLATLYALAAAAGWLHNDGAGALAWSTPSKSDVGLSAVENTALSTWAGSANLATLGTIATGVWSGTIITLAKGGTGFDASGIAKGGLLSGTGAGTAGLTVVGADGTVLSADAASAGGVKWIAASSSPHALLDGTLNNDTLAAGPTRGDLIVANSTPKWARFAVGAAGTFLQGGTDPSWAKIPAISSTYFTSLAGDNLTNVALLNAANVFTLAQTIQTTASTAVLLTLSKTGGTPQSWGLHVNTTGQLSFDNITATTFPFVLTTTGNLSLTGGVDATTFTPSALAAMTTIAESWIGPSSTAGIYFKGGNVGIGTNGPVSLFEVVGSTTNSSVKAGNFEIQGYAVNNGWLGDNLYYNAGWKYRANGYGGVVAFDTGDILFRTAPSGLAGGSPAVTTLVTIKNTGNVGIGTAGPGYKLDVQGGDINTSGDVRKAGAAYTNPDYVLEHWATGAIVKFTDRIGASTYAGLAQLAEVEALARTTFMLPRIADWRAGLAGSTGLFGGSEAVLASVEEAYLYLFQLDARIRQLEGMMH